ncbi:hypothetical protein KM043_002339 [Ampulex compressa]|nr:hypothetical protein KM043_002339 [Ampulex compressa]
MCSKTDFPLIRPLRPCRRMPWKTQEEDRLNEGQLGAVYQSTRLDHETRLDINSNPKPARLTGIMVTLGNANSHPCAIADVVMAGANVVRLNMSHRDDKWHAITVQSIREAGNRIYRCTCEVYPLAVAMDLRGPEIRAGIFRGDEASIGSASLKEGNVVRLLTNEVAKRAGCASCFWVSYSDLPRICRVGDRILIDRGPPLLRVTCIGDTFVVCTVLKGGVIKDESIVHLLDSAVALPQVSKEDDAHIGLALDLECDFLIVNHARCAKMIYAVRKRIADIGTNPICVLAKISSRQGVENLDEILEVSDGILLDRASIEINVKSEKMFLIQKSIIAKCIRVGKPIAVTFRGGGNTESKIDMDLIASAVLDGADAVFLTTGNMNTRETVELVKNIDVVCREAESARWQRQIFNELSYKAATCAPTHSSPVKSAAAVSRIYKGSLGIDTLRIITGITCDSVTSCDLPPWHRRTINPRGRSSSHLPDPTVSEYPEKMLAKSCLTPFLLLAIVGMSSATESYMDYGDDGADKSPAENIHELYRLLLQRNALENAAYSGIPLEHLMIRKSQRSPSLRLRFGRSGPRVSTGVLPRPIGEMAARYEDNN